jgi:quercetin dioxygenase-like cupin family protein
MMTHYDWQQLPPEQLNPQTTRRAIHTRGLTMARLELRKGGEVPEHAHVHEQISTVERGALQCWIGGEQLILRGGQSVTIPSNVPHRVLALEETAVLDVFTPCREDWMQSNDKSVKK